MGTSISGFFLSSSGKCIKAPLINAEVIFRQADGMRPTQKEVYLQPRFYNSRASYFNRDERDERDGGSKKPVLENPA
jgi:hypothetical protein